MKMTRNARENCAHESCDMEPCSKYDFATYAYDEVWGWMTTCERCDYQMFACLPEEHVEARHEDRS